MKYRFHLARVLKVKQIWENQAKLALKLRTAARNEEERLLKDRETGLDAAWRRLTAGGLRTARDLILGAADLKAAKRLYVEQEDRVKKATAAWDEARRQFMYRRAERQVLSRLEERAREEYLLVARRVESRELDQVAAVAYARRKGNG
jgi:NADPH-dependent glutamate synthase beta subunit-like oxidoreductase